ncbi:MAG: DNA polymerase III subunit gamma/tau [Anaerolineae bacterium]|nr:DNA polymerase III subunit gamma/tau [Anaerolineae bacterium]MDW8171311.1 DNA polymerase III subunit gamma/tau [Anaerolineae bacterium]
MPEQALYLKWRPPTFDEMVGQEHIVRTLRNSLKAGRIRHAYLFSGPRGTGKTTSARLLAKAVNCLHPDPERRPCNECRHCLAVNEGRFLDLIEIDAASHTGVDDVRELRERIAFQPSEGKYKVYIIDEVHRFSGNAFDALLKTLEEPPNHAIFVLATTEIDRVPATIKSRCLPFEFRRLSLKEVADRLEEIARSEGIRIERAALELIAREGTGSVRDSISLLDQVMADPHELVTVELARRILGTANVQKVREVVACIVARDASEGLRLLNEAIDQGSEARQFGQQIVEHLRCIMLAQNGAADLLEASAEDRALYQQQAAQISRAQLLRALRAFNQASTSLGGGWQPQLGLEIALLESLQEAPQAPAPLASLMAEAPRAAAPAPRPVEAAALPLVSSEPPVVPAALLNERWQQARSLIHQHSNHPNTPRQVNGLADLMGYAWVKQVDGHVVTVGVSRKPYLTLLRDETRTRWLERALSRVSGVLDEKGMELRVRYVLDENAPHEATPSPELLDDPFYRPIYDAGGRLADEE